MDPLRSKPSNFTPIFPPRACALQYSYLHAPRAKACRTVAIFIHARTETWTIHLQSGMSTRRHGGTHRASPSRYFHAHALRRKQCKRMTTCSVTMLPHSSAVHVLYCTLQGAASFLLQMSCSRFYAREVHRCIKSLDMLER